MTDHPQYWQTGPTGASGPFLGVTGAVTGPAFFGITGATGPTGLHQSHPHMHHLYNRARMELVGASDTLVRMAMYDILHEFFNDSAIWEEAIPGEIQPNTIYYQLEPGQVQSLGDAFPPGVIIRLASVADLQMIPISADMPYPPVMRLQFVPTNSQSVFVTVVKNISVPPIGELPKIPAWIADQYLPRFIAGVKGMLMLQTDKPYSDAKAGMQQYQAFRQGVDMARVAALRRHTQGGQAWAFPQQFRTRTQRAFGVSVGIASRFGGV